MQKSASVLFDRPVSIMRNRERKREREKERKRKGRNYLRSTLARFNTIKMRGKERKRGLTERANRTFAHCPAGETLRVFYRPSNIECTLHSPIDSRSRAFPCFSAPSNSSWFGLSIIRLPSCTSPHDFPPWGKFQRVRGEETLTQRRKRNDRPLVM